MIVVMHPLRLAPTVSCIPAYIIPPYTLFSVDSDLLRSFTQRASVLHDVLRNEEQVR